MFRFNKVNHIYVYNLLYALSALWHYLHYLHYRHYGLAMPGFPVSPAPVQRSPREQ